MRKLVLGCGAVVTTVVILCAVIVGLARLGVTGSAAIVGDAFDQLTGSKDEPLADVRSPDGQFASIMTATYSWDDDIGVGLETVDGHEGHPILGITDRGAEERQVALKWSGNRTLEVTYSGRPEEIYFKDLGDWGGVHVVYVQKPATP